MGREVHIEAQKKKEGKNHWGICIMPSGDLVRLKARLVAEQLFSPTHWFLPEYCSHSHGIIHTAKSHERQHAVFLSLSHTDININTQAAAKIWRDRQDAQLSSMLAKPCQNSQFCQVSVRGKESAKGRVGVGMEGWDPHTWKKGREGTTGWFIQRVRSGWIKL